MLPQRRQARVLHALAGAQAASKQQSASSQVPWTVEHHVIG